MCQKRKWLYIFVLLVVIASLSACTQQDTPVPSVDEAAPEADEPMDAEEEPEVEEAAPEEPVTIRFQDWRLAEEPANTALRHRRNMNCLGRP